MSVIVAEVLCYPKKGAVDQEQKTGKTAATTSNVTTRATF